MHIIASMHVRVCLPFTEITQHDLFRGKHELTKISVILDHRIGVLIKCSGTYLYQNILGARIGLFNFKFRGPGQNLGPRMRGKISLFFNFSLWHNHPCKMPKAENVAISSTFGCKVSKWARVAQSVKPG
jgi:hypothetical protein